MKKIVSLVLVLTSFGCANMSSLQTAKALKVDEARTLIGGGYYKSPVLAGTSVEDAKFPYLEGGYRRGLMPQLEAGVKLTIPGTIAIDGKYQLVDMGQFAVAAGLGIGYLSYSSGDIKATVIDTLVPVYVSYDVLEWLAFYSSPKYLLRYTSSTTSGATNLIGASAGLKLGVNGGVFIEGTYMKDVSSTFSATQFNASVFF